MADFEVKIKGKINCFDILLEGKSTKILKNLLTAATCLAHEIIRAEKRGERIERVLTPKVFVS